MFHRKGVWKRVIELDRRIRAREFPNCSSFAREWEVSRKTVQRDVDFLRDQLGAPLEYDAGRRGFHYIEPTWSLPALAITEGELVQLLLAERMAEQYEGTPVAKTLESLFAKIKSVLSDPVSIDPALLETRFSFHGMPARPISAGVWLSVVRALRGRRVLRVTYRTVEDGEETVRLVEPLHLANVGGEWYLVAYCRRKHALRHFALSRFLRVRIRAETFPARDFDPALYFSNRFGRFIGKPDDAYRIKVRFSSEAAPWVEERIWHSGQSIRKHRDGRLTLAFPAPALEEVKRWVMQWGSAAEVLAPAHLRAEVADEAARVAQLYA